MPWVKIVFGRKQGGRKNRQNREEKRRTQLQKSKRKRKGGRGEEERRRKKMRGKDQKKIGIFRQISREKAVFHAAYGHDD